MVSVGLAAPTNLLRRLILRFFVNEKGKKRSNLLKKTLFLAGSGVKGTEHTPLKQNDIKISLEKGQSR